MQKTKSENNISIINSNVFFKEFTFSKNDFKDLDTNQKLEFADNVVWLDDILFIIQIKDKEGENGNEKKWFENKILKKAVLQIKSTLNYLENFNEISIQNEKGHFLNIVNAQNCKTKRKIIIYDSHESFPEDLRQKKFYQSSKIGLVHLFHAEDYYWICRFLITPAEIDEYLEFREQYFLENKELSIQLPEQYFLAHFFETLETNHYEPKYILNLKEQTINSEEFSIKFLMDVFSNRITLTKHQTEYYEIIKEIAKLNRTELYEFRIRFLKMIEKCDDKEIITPFRIHVPRTDCAFVFIPFKTYLSKYWQNALNNFLLAHKYDQKATKCVGVIAYRDDKDSSFYQVFWSYINEKWSYDENIETLLSDNNPFREVKTKVIDNRYKNDL